jgi:hypothetical protein
LPTFAIFLPTFANLHHFNSCDECLCDADITLCKGDDSFERRCDHCITKSELMLDGQKQCLFAKGDQSLVLFHNKATTLYPGWIRSHDPLLQSLDTTRPRRQGSEAGSFLKAYTLYPGGIRSYDQ